MQKFHFLSLAGSYIDVNCCLCGLCKGPTSLPLTQEVALNKCLVVTPKYASLTICFISLSCIEKLGFSAVNNSYVCQAISKKLTTAITLSLFFNTKDKSDVIKTRHTDTRPRHDCCKKFSSCK